MPTKTAEKPVISPQERSEFDSMTSPANYAKSGSEPKRGGPLGTAKGVGQGAVTGARKGAQSAQEQGKKDAHQGLIKKGFNNLAKKGMAAAGKQAGRATGLGDAKEQAKDIKALASGSMKE